MGERAAKVSMSHRKPESAAKELGILSLAIEYMRLPPVNDLMMSALKKVGLASVDSPIWKLQYIWYIWHRMA